MNCPDSSGLATAEYIRQFNTRASKSRTPLSGSMDITARCNMSCVHCYMDRTQPCYPSKEMGTRRILSLIDEITDAGCLYFLITGGEPLTRPDFPMIYRRAKENGLLVTLFTNGTLVDAETVTLLSELPPRMVEISLYGSTAETYERITGVPGSFERCMAGIRLLLDAGIGVRLKTILMTLNRHEFSEIEAMASDLGVDFRFDAALFPRINGDRYPLSLRVSPEEAVHMELSTEERRLKWAKYHRKTSGECLSDRLYSCGAGITGFHIDSAGRLKPCLMSEGPAYDISEAGFADGWNEIGVITERKLDISQDCSACKSRHLCGYCPAFFGMETGSEDLKSEYICKMGSIRHSIIDNCDMNERDYGYGKAREEALR